MFQSCSSNPLSSILATKELDRVGVIFCAYSINGEGVSKGESKVRELYLKVQ